jgi:hypothetical protein
MPCRSIDINSMNQIWRGDSIKILAQGKKGVGKGKT